MCVKLKRLIAASHVSLSSDEISQQNDKNENKQGHSDSYGNNEALPISRAILGCTKSILLNSKRLYVEIKGEDCQMFSDGIILLLCAHVRAAESRLPKSHVAIDL